MVQSKAAPVLDRALPGEGAAACTIWHIAHRLGRDDYGTARMVAYVSGLISDYGFPPPFPVLKSGALITGVRKDSRWDRAAVEHWLHDFLPPDAAAALDGAARAAAAQDMDRAAHGLILVRGGRA